MWLWFLALHLVGLVGYSLLLRKSVREHTNQLVLATVMQTGIAIPSAIALFVMPPDIFAYSLPSAALMVACAILVVAVHLANVKALTYLDIGTYSILFNVRLVFTTILGMVLLDEQILPLQVVGGLLIFLAVFTLHHKDGKHLPLAGAFWGIVAALAISVLNAGEKELITTVGLMHFAIPVMLLASAMLWVMLLVSKQPAHLGTFVQPRMLSLMTLRAFSTWGIMLAFSAGALISIANYISGLSVVILVVLGILLLHERHYLRQKIVATVLAVLGLTAILIAAV